MNASSLTALIKSKYAKMTNAEKKVADFVTANPEQSLNSTITDLAKLCGVGDTSVFRFCKTMGYNGYQEFRISLALSNNNTPNEFSLASYDAAKEDNDIPREILNIYTSALQKTYASLDYKAIEQAVQLLSDAHFIYCFGAGGSAVSAAETHMKFSKIIPNIGFDADLHQQLTKASLLKPGYVSIIYSNSGTTKDAIQIAKLSHERGAKVIFITEFLHTPAAEYCDVLLLSGAAEGPFEGGSITAKTSQLFMMDILYSMFFRRMGYQATENKKLSSSVIADKML